MKHNELQYQFTSTFVYAKCKDHLRRPLWDKIIQQPTLNDNPLCAVNEFNVITSVERKHRGVPYNMRKSMDFIAVIEAMAFWTLLFIVRNSPSPTREVLIT